MFASLSARIVGIGIVVVVALICLAGLLADASYQTSKSFRLVTHSADVIETAEVALSDLREAESGQRGFILTHNPIYARSFSERVKSSARHIASVVQLTDDNPLQHSRARELADLMAQRSTILLQPLSLGQHGNFVGATAVVAGGRGRELMDALAVRGQAFLDEERRLQTDRSVAAEQRLASGKWLALIGASVVAMLVMVSFAFLIRGIRRPLATMMQAMDELGSGERSARIETTMGSREFSHLAQGYNVMADRLISAVADREESEQRLQVANDELQQNGEALRERGDVIELLGGMAHRMQAARTDDELAAIIKVFVPRVLPGLAGALYAHNNSRNLLTLVAGWGGGQAPLESFAPD